MHLTLTYHSSFSYASSKLFPADIMCDPLPNPINGFITFTEDTTSLGFMATATYGCDMGFGLLGGDRVSTCGSSSSGPGEWSGTAPACERMYKSLHITLSESDYKLCFLFPQL